MGSTRPTHRRDAEGAEGVQRNPSSVVVDYFPMNPIFKDRDVEIDG
jgi:hypothetical protein